MINMIAGEATHESDVLWRGRPWVVPAFVGDTIAVVAFAIALTWLELVLHFAFVSISSIPILALTYFGILLVWLIAAANLAVIRASSIYTLRNSSLEVSHGIIGKRVFTLSAAGFSDLEVIQGPLGRLLTMGEIVMETDSHRDLRLSRVRDPMKVSAMIRQVMTVPVVRLTTGNPVVDQGSKAV
jgi:membrane protein YdbS with pleckstrin-like domain